MDTNDRKCVGVRLTEHAYLLLGYIVVSRDCTRREFYEEAFSRFLSERTAEGFVYRVGPKQGKSVSIVCERELADRVGGAAEGDNVPRKAAYYTAIKNHIERCREEVVPLAEMTHG